MRHGDTSNAAGQHSAETRHATVRDGTTTPRGGDHRSGRGRPPGSRRPSVIPLVRLAVVLATALLLVTSLGAFAGPAAADVGNESTTDRVVPTQFDTEEGDVLWESDVDLESYSEPIVVDGILVTIADGDDSSEQVVAYDVGTGEQRWATEISARELTAADGTIYASGSGGVYRLDLGLGTIEWHAEFDAGGMAVGDKTVYAVEKTSASSYLLTALDAETGDEEWTKETDEVLSGPTAVDGTVYAVNSGGMVAVNPDNGDERWQWDAEENIDIASGPTVADGHVYVSHSAGDDDPGFVSAVDVTDGEEVWQEELGIAQGALATVPTTPTVAGENNESTVYVGYDELYALDSIDGSERWSDEDAVFDAPTVADGTLFVPQTTESTEFRALDPNDGTELWSVDTGDRSEVVVVDGVAYVAVTTGDRRLIAIDAGVAGSSSDSRIMLGGHHHKWTGEIPDVEPRIVDVEHDEGVFVGDELTVLATVRNDWDPTTSATYTLELDGDSQVSRTIDVPAYGTNTVELPVTAPDTAGEDALTIGDEEVGTLTVVDEDDPVFRSVNPFFDTRLEGDLIQISYDATNLGTEAVDEENATLALEGPAFDGREDVAFAGLGEGINAGETRTLILATDPIDEPGEYTAFVEGDEIGTITVLPGDEPIYLTDTNRLHDSIISGIEAPVEPSAAGKASVDVRYENLGEDTESVESELVAYDNTGVEAASVTETIEIDGESNTIERLSVPLAEPGVYDLEVDGEPVGEVEVLVDGVQDGDSIQAAIDAALPGDEVVVGDGTYEESLTIDKELTLRTVSEGGAVLDGSGEKFERAITVTEDDVTVEGFRIEGYTGSGSGFGDAAVVVGGEQVGFFNNTITDSVDGIQTQSNENAHGIVIADNHIHDNDGDAIMFANRVDDASVLRNTITDNGGAGLDLGNQNDRFTVDANEIHRNADGITYEQTGGNDGEVTNNTVTDNSGAGIDLGSSSAPDNVVDNNTVTGNENGITAGLRAEVRYNNVTATSGNGIDGLRFGVVANNTLKDVGSIGIEPGASTEIKYNTFTDVSIGISSDADNLDIHGNEFTGTDTDLRLERGPLGIDGATVTDNQFATGIILIGMPDEPHEMSDNTVGGDPLVYIEGEDDPTIDADAGQVILVDVTNADLEGFSFSDVTAGTQITDSEEISITDTEFTDISAASPTVTADDEGVVSVSYSSGVTIDDFTVTNSERGVFVTDSDNVTVSNGIISATTDRGIFIDDTDDVTVEHNTITGEYNDGIRVDGSENLSIVGNEVTGETRGIGIVAATDAVVTDNTIDGTTTGVRFGTTFGSSDIQGLTFTNNTVTGGSDGVANPRGSITDGAMFTENIIIGNDGVGLDVDIGEDGGTVANNTITNNEVGLDLTRRGPTPVQNLDVTDNTIGDNEGDGLRLDGATNVIVTDNSITDNDVGLAYSGSEDLDARNNWWGAENGPSGGVSDPVEGTVAEGDGDSIESSSDAVRFDPWLEAPIFDTGTLSGTVTDADTDEQIGDATVEVRDGTAVISATKTDADGSYELPLTVGTYDVAANADGYDEAIKEGVTIDDGEETIANLTLTPTQDGSIEGIVIDSESSDPITGAAIEVVEQRGIGQPPAAGGFTTTVETDEDGDFSVDVPPGVYEYTVSKTGFDEAGGTDVEVGSGEQVDQGTIELTAFPVVTGTVTNAVTGDAIEGVSVESSAIGVSEPFDTAVTDATGEYVITVPDEIAQLDFTSLGYIPEQVSVNGQDIDGTEQVDVELTLEDDLGIVTGTVTRESTGEPVQGAIVIATDEEGSQADSASTGPDGVYELQVEPGTYTITATEEGGPGLPESGSVEDVEVSFSEQKTVDIELTPRASSSPSDVTVAIDAAESVTDVTEGEHITVVAEATNSGGEERTQMVGLAVVEEMPPLSETIESEESIAVQEATTSDPTDDEPLYESELMEITIGADETESVTFEFESNLTFNDTTAIVVSFDPGAEEPEDFDTIGLSVSEQPATLESITLDAAETTLTEGSTTPVTVTAAFDDGTALDVTDETTIESDDTDVVSVDGTTLQAEGPGTATITATYEGETDSLELTVEADEEEEETSSSSGGGSSSSPDPEPELDVLNATVTPTQLQAGEQATIEATVENVGDDGELTVPLEINGEEVNSTTVTLDSGETTNLTFTHTFETAGAFQLSVDGVTAGEVTVMQAEPADIVIYGADVNQSSLLLGETITITGDLFNNGGTGTFDVDLNVNGDVVDSTTVEVGPGATPGGVEFEWTPTEADLPADADEMDATITLNGFVVDTVHITNPYSDIQVIAASASDIELVEGEEMYVVGSIYQAGTIEGTEDIELTATNIDTGESEVVGSQEVTLGAGFYHLGALNISYTPEEAGTYDLELGDRNVGTIEVEAAESDIQVIAASNSELELVEGEQAYVVGSIYQAGNIEGTEEIELTATNTDTGESEVVGSQEVTLSPGFYHLGALNISYTPEEAGTYDLELGDGNAGTIEVEAAESDIQVIAASSSEIELVAGEEMYVVGSIHQAGNIEGTEEIELTATNTDTGESEVVGSQEVTLSPGFYHLGALNISYSPEEAGTYDLKLGDRNAGTIEVEAAESDINVIAASPSEINVLEDEELHVVGSIYQAGNIEGTEEIDLTATNTDTDETEVLGSQEVTLSPGFYHLGAINVTAAFDGAGTYDLTLGDRNAGTIEVEPRDADIQVIAASASEVEVIAGEKLHVVGSIHNQGDDEGTEEIELTATNTDTNETEVLGSQEVTLDAGLFHLGAINVTAEFDEAGTYDLTLGERDAGLVAVEEAITDITVIAASAGDIELVAGEESYVVGSIYQNGNVEETEEIELTATNTDTNETAVLGSQEVTLSPGVYHLGALNISYVPEEAGTYDLTLGDRNAGTIEVEPAETDIQVIAASNSRVEMVAGEESYVVGSIYQAGNVEGTEEIELTATNTDTGESEVVGSQEVTLGAGFYHLGAINVTFAPEEAGTYELELGDQNAGTIEVEPAESDIQVIAASNSELELVEGEQAYVVGSIYQAGNIEGTEEIELTATNTDTGESEVFGSQEVTLSPGFYHLGALNISYTPEEAGTYDLELGDRNAGTIEVEAAESDIQVIAASNSRVEMVAGEESYVVGSIHQAGNIEGTEEIELTATNTDTGESEVVGSQEVTLSPGFYHLGALNISYTPEQAGTYDLELGDRTAGTVAVDEPTVELSAVEVDGYGEAFDPDTETEQVYASDEASVSVDIDADLNLETVNVLVSSLETNYVRAFEASHESGSTWTLTVPPADIQDDGRYEVSVIAVDEVGTAGSATAERPLVINRDSPRLSATLEDVDGESATVVVESNEPLVDPPEVKGVFTGPDNSTESDSVAMIGVGGSDTHFTGSFATGETGTYEITSVGTDRAGNEGTDTASATVDTRFTLGDGVIELADTGTAIEFDVADDADEALLAQELFLSLSETTANANLDDGDLGVNFITADLDNLLSYYLDEGTVESASISMAIDEATLPAGASADDVELQYYDDASGTWDPVADSTVTQIDDDPFVTASVTGFSTYGAFVPDTEPPRIVDRSPAEGTTLDADTEETTVRFEYDDDRSGVDVGSITLEVDGEDVTASDGTEITSTEATHVLAIEPGQSYEAAVTVADTAGNVERYATSFSVDEEPADDADVPDDEDVPAEDAPGDDEDAPEEDGAGTEDHEDTADAQPGFDLAVAVVAALFVASLAARRR